MLDCHLAEPSDSFRLPKIPAFRAWLGNFTKTSMASSDRIEVSQVSMSGIKRVGLVPDLSDLVVHKEANFSPSSQAEYR